MIMKPVTLTFFFILVAFQLHAQIINVDDCVTKTEQRGNSTIKYKLCDGILADTLYEYNQRGKLLSWTNYGSNPAPTDLVEYCSFNYKWLDPLKKTTGWFTADGKRTGEWKYYRKRDILWDLVVYENDIKKRRVRYDRTGQTVRFENKY